MYAVIADRGKQYLVRPGERVRLDLREEEPGAKVTFDQVLLTSDGSEIRAGTPMLGGALVQCTVVGLVKGPKLIVFKKRRRKGLRRKNGHRQRYTDVIVDSIG